MVRLHEQFLAPTEGLTFHPSQEKEQKKQGKENRIQLHKVISVAKFLADNAQQGSVAFLLHRFGDFDPIVTDNSCQIRALHLMKAAHDPELFREAQVLVEQAKRVKSKSDEVMHLLLSQKLATPSSETAFSEVITALELELEVSEKMAFLLQSHFLSCGKIFEEDKSSGQQIPKISLTMLKKKFGECQLSRDLLGNEILLITQGKIAEASIAFIQQMAEVLKGEEMSLCARQLSDKNIREIHSHHRHLKRCSSTFFNFLAIIGHLKEDRALLFVKENKEVGARGTFFTSAFAQGPFLPMTAVSTCALDPGTPVFAIEGFMPSDFQSDLEKVGGLSNMIFVNVAHVPQFKVDSGEALEDDLPQESEARNRVAHFRSVAKRLGCDMEDPERRFFTITHTHALSLKEALVGCSIFDIAQGGFS
jgi:hypothetical protein